MSASAQMVRKLIGDSFICFVIHEEVFAECRPCAWLYAQRELGLPRSPLHHQDHVNDGRSSWFTVQTTVWPEVNMVVNR